MLKDIERMGVGRRVWTERKKCKDEGIRNKHGLCHELLLHIYSQANLLLHMTFSNTDTGLHCSNVIK